MGFSQDSQMENVFTEILGIIQNSHLASQELVAL